MLSIAYTRAYRPCGSIDYLAARNSSMDPMPSRQVTYLVGGDTEVMVVGISNPTCDCVNVTGSGLLTGWWSLCTSIAM